MIRYVLLLVLLTVYAEGASIIPTEKPPDCPGENQIWYPCGYTCRRPCVVIHDQYVDCLALIQNCIPSISTGACGCRLGYEPDKNGRCVQCGRRNL